MRRWRAASVAVAFALLTGCGGGDDGVDKAVDSAARTTVAATTTAPVRTEPTEPSTTPTPTTPTPTAATPTSPPSTIAEGVVPGTAIITSLTHGSGLGARPLLRWEAVGGAVSYVVSVNAPSGGPLWA